MVVVAVSVAVVVAGSVFEVVAGSVVEVVDAEGILPVVKKEFGTKGGIDITTLGIVGLTNTVVKSRHVPSLFLKHLTFFGSEVVVVVVVWLRLLLQ